MSVNFGFLAEHDGVLVHHAAQAEGLFRPNPRLCVVQLRTFAEALAKQSAAYAGVYLQDREELAFLLGRLRDRGILDAQIFALFRTLREAGNDAVHVSSPDRPARSFTHSEALKMLRIARELAVWFHRSFGVPQYKAGPFVPPPDPPPPPVDFPDADVTEELNRLRAEVVRLSEVSASAAEHARLRREAEARAAQAYADVEAALALATEASERLEAEKAQFLEKLAAIQSASTASSPENREILIRNVQSATRRFELDEQATRALIDAQLREAGWEADSSSIRYARGARPVKGRNLAIAEWPTRSGPADYALFSGLTLLAVVEAKKISVDVMGALAQARRYARSIRLEGGAVLPGGPWGEDKLAFIFSTNGRPFLQQHRTLSGIWFRDLRRPQNPELPLVAWKTPQGLLDALNTDIDAAHAALRAEPTDLLGLRPYQVEAIRAVERGIEEGQRALLVAMATGTGKTRTCVGLIYRLIKTRRFSRVLFLVDRTSLGEQAAEAFITEKVEDLRSFADIYGVKTLEDLRADPETRLHFATVQ
ncbi:MAG TPA: DEAD/DEAH box helicase family protein, partial [Myxococcota bacterium]|nr:DEAD/DEAH box helicase family protein [Myxococcota bacterium]